MKHKSYDRLIWNYNNADFGLFRSKLTEINWDECLNEIDIDDSVNKWTETFLNVARECIPNKVVCIRPWDKYFYNAYLRR